MTEISDSNLPTGKVFYLAGFANLPSAAGLQCNKNASGSLLVTPHTRCIYRVLERGIGPTTRLVDELSKLWYWWYHRLYRIIREAGEKYPCPIVTKEEV